MQKPSLDCRQARLRIDAYLDGADTSPALTAHLGVCEECLEACLEAALSRPEQVRVPADFAARTLARLPARSIAPKSVLPYMLAAAYILFTVFGVMWLSSGAFAAVTRWLEQTVTRPGPLLAVAAFETALSLLWLWRLSRA